MERKNIMIKKRTAAILLSTAFMAGALFTGCKGESTADELNVSSDGNSVTLPTLK